MPAFVKTAKDEEIWSKAKEIASQKFGDAKTDSFYAYANTVFHRMKGLDESSEVPKPFINSIEEEDRYKKIKNFVFDHPVYAELKEDEKYDMVENVHTAYSLQESPGELLEFVSSFMPSGGIGSTGGSYGGIPGGFNGLGGYRDEKPKGPYVYGIKNNDGMEPLSIDRDPAIVVVPPKKSNYRPWETEMDPNGNTKTDVERAQHINAEDEEWNGPLGDVLTKLEDMGIDIETLGHMTQEEIEDLLLKAVKKDTSLTQTQQAQQSVGQTKNIKEKIMEAFSFGEFMEKLDREGRIQKGREFLASKLQKKDATEKENNSRRYKYDQYDIERMLSQAGYSYNYERKEWMKKEPRQVAQQPEAPVVAVEPSERPEAVPSEYTGPQMVTAPVAAPVVSKPVDVPVVPKKENPDLMKDPNIRHMMKILQARFILAMAHNNKESSEYVEDEKTKEKKPVIKDEDIVNKIELLKYTWNPDKLIWLDSNMSLPHIIFNNNESQKTLIGRAFLAALGNLNKIHINSSGKASSNVDTIISDMKSQNYNWNEEIRRWKYEEPEDAKTKLNEAAVNGPQIPYNVEESVEMCGRYLLRASQIKNLRGASLPADVARLQKELDDFDPTNIPSMAWHLVEQKLGQDGFILTGNEFKKWTDSNTKHFPDCVESMGDDEPSFLGRGALGAKNEAKAAVYIMIQIIGKGSKNVKGAPAKRPEWIKQELTRQKMQFNEDIGGWVSEDASKDKTDSEINAPYKHASGLTKEKQKFIDQFRNANWDYMSWADRDKYKEYTGETLAAKELGIQPENWPQGNDPMSSFKRSRYMRKFSQNYKFSVDPKSGEKTWVRRNNPVMRSLDKTGLKAAMGSIGRKLASTAKAATWAGGGLASILSKLGSSQA